MLGSIQGILLAVILFTKKNNHYANIFLSIAVFALSIDVFHSAYIIFEYYKVFPHFTGIPYAFPFLYGPIFYLYVKLISSEENNFDRKYFLHFIPFVIVVLYGIVFVYLKSSEFKFALIKNELAQPLPGLKLISYLKPVHGIIYVFFTINLATEYNRKIKNSFSSIERINLNWIKHLTIGLSVVWGIVLISYVVNALSEKKVEMDHLIYMAASVLIYSIGYLSLRQPQIFHQTIQQPEPEPIKDNKKEIVQPSSYRKSGLTDLEAENYLKELLHKMENEKLYLNTELTLGELSEKLSISSHNLSEILNTRLNQNFYDFINRYRVEEVKRRLANGDSDKFNLIAIAFDSGFNSKSTFNTIFKKITGLTPSQYRDQLSDIK